jgi:type I restriction enzyme, S subunit
MGAPMTTSQDFVNWVCGPELDHRYLKYVLLAEHDALLRFASGTTHQTVYFPEVKAFHACLPEMAEQHSIADVLGALDDKIEANRRIAALCRALGDVALAQARAEDAQDSNVGELVAFHNRRRVPLSAKQRLEIPGPYPYYGATGVFDYLSAFLFDERLLLVGEDGSVVRGDGTAVTQYIWGKCWVNNHAHVLTGRSVTTELAFLLLSQVDVRPVVTGAAQPKLSMGNLKSVELRIPAARFLPKLEATIDRLFARLRSATDENRYLVALRDALLPELLSGRLRVPEAEDVVASAT